MRMDSAEARTSGRKARPTRKAPLKPKNGLNGPPDLSPGLSSRIARLVGVRSRCCFRLMILRDGYLYRYGGSSGQRLCRADCARLSAGYGRAFYGLALFGECTYFGIQVNGSLPTSRASVLFPSGETYG